MSSKKSETAVYGCNPALLKFYLCHVDVLQSQIFLRSQISLAAFFANPTLVSEHFNLPEHSVNDIRLIPLELIHTNRDSLRKAREAHLIDKAKTLEPQGLNRRDELH